MTTCVQLVSGFACGKPTENGAERCAEHAAYHASKREVVLTLDESAGIYRCTSDNCSHDFAPYFGRDFADVRDIRYTVNRLENLGFRVRLVETTDADTLNPHGVVTMESVTVIAECQNGLMIVSHAENRDFAVSQTVETSEDMISERGDGWQIVGWIDPHSARGIEILSQFDYAEFCGDVVDETLGETISPRCDTCGSTADVKPSRDGTAYRCLRCALDNLRLVPTLPAATPGCHEHEFVNAGKEETEIPVTSWYRVRYSDNGIDRGYQNFVRAYSSEEAKSHVLRDMRWSNQDFRRGKESFRTVLSVEPYEFPEPCRDTNSYRGLDIGAYGDY